MRNRDVTCEYLTSKTHHRKSRRTKFIAARALFVICTRYNSAPMLQEKCSRFQPIRRALFCYVYC